MSDDMLPIGLNWEASYAIVLELCERYPDVDVEAVGLDQLKQWIIALPGFTDDPDFANESILNDILREWYEEVSG